LALQATGSILLATSEEEQQQLADRATMLQQQGLEGVVLLDQQQLQREEPALKLPPGAAGLMVTSDAQLVRGGKAAGKGFGGENTLAGTRGQAGARN
jgi:L-2-hydroxyglutarate oxidase LhgO